ncbi:hypothetical protein [Virgibacillus doumboii]|uniref:hypothetical protein n=1 Tax=Virgibacillus doumboii TaxID=2697503 RepID=UPI0013E03DBC|nr:hypothetical protein [Virgibacillus doumboii]
MGDRIEEERQFLFIIVVFLLLLTACSNEVGRETKEGTAKEENIVTNNMNS